MNREHAVTLTDILQARKRLTGLIRRTEVSESPSLHRLLGQPVFLKLEHRQTTGSFKLRGAAHAVHCLPPERRAAGVVGVSTGNYGRALAHAASRAGVPCTICMSNLVPWNKVENVRAAGAEVLIVGSSQDEAQVEVDRLVREAGKTMLPPFDHADVIAGQGTLGLEVLEDIPDAGTIVVPLSGGGLAAGIGISAKAVNPDIEVVAVCMERGASMVSSLEAGRPVEVPEYRSLADSLGGGIGLANRYTFTLVRDLVDRTVLLSEAEIAAGIRHAYHEEGEVLEGAGAVGIAAVLAGKLEASGPVVLLLTGRNIDPRLHLQILNGRNGPPSRS